MTESSRVSDILKDALLIDGKNINTVFKYKYTDELNQLEVA